ncbi:hypothetical protein AB4851_19920 [Burkholderia sp. 22PA0099]|uniref:hypothetical protein n=1 Tax=Burkholderia sp. 22PA0099 TaxID=3237372 RepID=UPI0039C33F49
MQENPVESGILVIYKLELQCARFQAEMHCRQGFCDAQETDLMQHKLAVALFVACGVAMRRAAVERGAAECTDAGNACRTDSVRPVRRGAANGKQNDNEVCLTIEAMHSRDRCAARDRSAVPAWQAEAVTHQIGMKIAQWMERLGAAGATHATVRHVPAHRLGFLDGLGIVRNTFFLNRPAVATVVAPSGERDADSIAPGVCVGMPDIGAAGHGVAQHVAVPAAIAYRATRQPRRLGDALASSNGGSAAGHHAGIAELRPTRQAARSCRTASRQDERIEARATYLMSVPRRPFARRPAACAHLGADMRNAAALGARMPNDFREARITVLDVVEM